MEDREKLRKRQREHDEADANAARLKGGAEVVEQGAATPIAEEVQEFFEILRRVHVAVRYFDKRINGDGDGRFSGRLREALETGRVELATATTTATTMMSEGDRGDSYERQIMGATADKPAAVAAQKNLLIDLNSKPDQDIVEI